MRNGLYSVQFQTPLGIGAGVVHAVDGKMWGGDASIFYLGSYTTDGDSLKATVQIDRHNRISGQPSVFGVDKATINLEGQVSGDSATTKGSSPQAPGLGFTATLNRIAE